MGKQWLSSSCLSIYWSLTGWAGCVGGVGAPVITGRLLGVRRLPWNKSDLEETVTLVSEEVSQTGFSLTIYGYYKTPAERFHDDIQCTGHETHMEEKCMMRGIHYRSTGVMKGEEHTSYPWYQLQQMVELKIVTARGGASFHRSFVTFMISIWGIKV